MRTGAGGFGAGVDGGGVAGDLSSRPKIRRISAAIWSGVLGPRAATLAAGFAAAGPACVVARPTTGACRWAFTGACTPVPGPPITERDAFASCPAGGTAGDADGHAEGDADGDADGAETGAGSLRFWLRARALG